MYYILIGYLWIKGTGNNLKKCYCFSKLIKISKLNLVYFKIVGQ